VVSYFVNSPIYAITQLGFVVLTLAAYGWTFHLFKAGMSAAGFSAERRKRTFRWSVALLGAWVFFISYFSLRGFFADFTGFPPRMAIVFVVPLVTIIALMFSKRFKEILLHVPPEKIIRLQVFRVFVEILLWLLLLQNLLPIQMSFEGRNFDILTGLTAPFVAWYVATRKWSPALLMAWNAAGLMLLFNIMIIAILSMPTPIRYFRNDPANTIVTTFPFIWLPGLLVPLAYALHAFSIRQILTSK
jgi:hypothetical protein